jgi:hypothetical protein
LETIFMAEEKRPIRTQIFHVKQSFQDLSLAAAMSVSGGAHEDARDPAKAAMPG